MQRLDHERVTSVNPNMSVKTMKVGSLKYIWIVDFLLHPDEFVAHMEEYPSYEGNPYISTPGARQYLSPVAIAGLMNGYSKVLKNEGIVTHPGKWVNCTNIMWKGMQGLVGSNRPHNDTGASIVANLWMSDDLGGTAFYRRGDDYCGDVLPTLGETTEEWTPFHGNDEWELYHVIPSRYNCVYIFDGQHYHAPYPVLTEKKRYSLVSFYHS